MKKTYSYKKASVLLTVSFPLVILVFNVVMAAYFAFHFHGAGLIVIFGILFLIFCGALLKIADIIKTTIVLDDQGISYNSVIKNIFIPWQDIVQVGRWVLIDMPRRRIQFPEPPPKDLKIITRNYGNIYVFDFLKSNDQEDNAMPQFIDEVRKMTQWGDTDSEWKGALHTRRIKIRTVIGIFIVVFGCLVPLLDERLQHQHSPRIKLLISLLGVPGTSILFIVIGLYTAFFLKIKSIK